LIQIIAEYSPSYKINMVNGWFY